MSRKERIEEKKAHAIECAERKPVIKKVVKKVEEKKEKKKDKKEKKMED